MKKTLPIVLTALVILVVAVAAWFALRPALTIAPTPTPSELGKRCGGNMQNAPTCGAGYHCAPEPGSHLPFGDVGGTCVAD